MAAGHFNAESTSQPAAIKPERRRPIVGGRQGYNPWPRLLIVLLNTSASVPERFARDHDGASRQFRACSGNRKWKHRCTRIRRDEHGWYLCHHRFGPEPVSIRPAFALSLLIRVNLRFHFLAPGGTQAPGWRTNAKLKNAVRTVPCVAESSARHWLDDQSASHRDASSSRPAVIPSPKLPVTGDIKA